MLPQWFELGKGRRVLSFLILTIISKLSYASKLKIEEIFVDSFYSWRILTGDSVTPYSYYSHRKETVEMQTTTLSYSIQSQKYRYRIPNINARESKLLLTCIFKAGHLSTDRFIGNSPK